MPPASEASAGNGRTQGHGAGAGSVTAATSASAAARGVDEAPPAVVLEADVAPASEASAIAARTQGHGAGAGSATAAASASAAAIPGELGYGTRDYFYYKKKCGNDSATYKAIDFMEDAKNMSDDDEDGMDEKEEEEEEEEEEDDHFDLDAYNDWLMAQGSETDLRDDFKEETIKTFTECIKHHGDCQHQNPMRMLRKNQQKDAEKEAEKQELAEKLKQELMQEVRTMIARNNNLLPTQEAIPRMNNTAADEHRSTEVNIGAAPTENGVRNAEENTSNVET
ncbi:nuclear polyadenylated RNA-binding protein 3-like [Panicum virgatum]|uniref:nuclear polyadenylated RNA-binding protein 3-like n=1 Tax=Panicum virgatum TaxID=38727 RepID=UPI0019D6316E|nr:nuclear polyadenylated RNA-binding protein 3-like [Panicum virgatum]